MIYINGQQHAIRRYEIACSELDDIAGHRQTQTYGALRVYT
jgi:hypothetical protein